MCVEYSSITSRLLAVVTMLRYNFMTKFLDPISVDPIIAS